MLRSMNFSLILLTLHVILSQTDAVNICGVRNSSESQGVCIFAIDCLRLKGQHVDVCMDQLYIKSCCALPGSIDTQLSSEQTLVQSHNNSISDKQTEVVSIRNWILAATESPENFQINNISQDKKNANIRNVEQKLKSGLNVPSDTDPRLVCGQTYHNYFPSSRIVGGEESKFAKWPWQVSLRHRKRTLFSHSCGGVLVSNLWVLTAAHCIHFKSKRDIQVRLGEFDQSNENEILPHIDYSISEIVSHPHYNERTFKNDIALLRLAKPTVFRANILPVCLPLSGKRNTTYNNVTAVVTGWGQLFPHGPYATKLQQVEIPIISNAQCREMLQKKTKLSLTITENLLCAALMTGGKDSCEGDSGGPMVVRRSDSRWELVGIISWGLECAKPGTPGVYTRVSKFIDWIQAVMATNNFLVTVNSSSSL